MSAPWERRERVLVVDDDAVTRMVLARAVSREGYEAIEAGDGLGAQAILTSNDPPQLIVLDWMMPGLSGLDLARWIRGVPALVTSYVCMVTSNSGLEDLIEGFAAGADDFVSKPVRAPELLARLRAGERVVRLQRALHERVSELQAALDEVRQLRGLIPICMHCHRIRSDSEQWQKMEAYIEARTDASFSHSICDECLEKHYPEEPAAEAGPEIGG